MHLILWYFKRVFSLDLRALGLLRIGLGALLLIDLFTRATDLEAHYSNTGVLPLNALFENSWNPFFFSVHTSSGLWQVELIFFLVAAAFAFMLLVGYKTRLATLISWILLLSVQNRNPLIIQGGDDLLRMMLFWGIFLPLGKFYSLDNRTACKPAQTTYFSAATVAFILQLFLLYFCTALLKNAPEWHAKGTAIYYALSLDQLVLPAGKLLYPYYDLLRFLTFSVYYTELLLPFLLFIPFYNAFFRMAVIGVLAGLHLGISITLFVGLFYLINLVSLLALIPGKQMDWLERKLIIPAGNICAGILNYRAFQNSLFPVSAAMQITWKPQHQPFLKMLREVLISFFLLYVAWWNLDNTPTRLLPFPDNFRWLGYWLRVDQNWGMFSPAVFKDDGWYILAGKTRNGRLIDLNRKGNSITYQKPESIVSLFKNDRWRKYSENYLFIANSWMRPYYCNYLLRTWNENHPATMQIKTLDVIYMKEVSLPHYRTEPVKREVLCSCATP